MGDPMELSHVVVCPHSACGEETNIHELPIHLQLCTAVCSPRQSSSVAGGSISSDSNYDDLDVSHPKASSSETSPSHETHNHNQCSHLEKYDELVLDLFANTLDSIAHNKVPETHAETERFQCPHLCEQLTSGRQLATHLESCSARDFCLQSNQSANEHCSHLTSLDYAVLLSAGVNVEGLQSFSGNKNVTTGDLSGTVMRNGGSVCPHEECHLEIDGDMETMLDHLLNSCKAHCDAIDGARICEHVLAVKEGNTGARGGDLTEQSVAESGRKKRKLSGESLEERQRLRAEKNRESARLCRLRRKEALKVEQETEKRLLLELDEVSKKNAALRAHAVELDNVIENTQKLFDESRKRLCFILAKSQSYAEQQNVDDHLSRAKKSSVQQQQHLSLVTSNKTDVFNKR
uniref:BZIP domain-containing protein n=1 Tax=Timspurckia oligopyrenoides TaxID=708627 RepID=A0A7S0ZF51_9RHOD